MSEQATAFQLRQALTQLLEGKQLYCAPVTVPGIGDVVPVQLSQATASGHLSSHDSLSGPFLEVAVHPTWWPALAVWPLSVEAILEDELQRPRGCANPKGGVGDGACPVAILSTEPAGSTRQAARRAQHPPRPGGHCQVSPVCLLERLPGK